MRLSYKYKLTIAFLLIELLFLTVIITYNYVTSKQFAKEIVDSNIKTTKLLVEELVLTPMSVYDLATLDDIVTKLGEASNIDCIRLKDKDNALLTMYSNNYDEEIEFDKYHKKIILDINHENIQIGKGYIVFNLTNIYHKIEKHTQDIIMIAAVEILLSFIISFLLGRKLASNLLILKDAVTQTGVTHGQNKDVNINSKDEFDDLAHAFNNMSHTIKDHIDNLDFKVKVKTKKLRQSKQKALELLDNSGEGFLSFGADFAIESEYSQECKIIFQNDNIVGKNILDMLLSKDLEKYSDMKMVLENIFTCDDKSQIELFISLLPTNFEIYRKFYTVKYISLEENRLMMILNDITEKKALEKTILQEQQKLKFVVSILKDKDLLKNMISDYKNFVNTTLEKLLNNSMDNKERYELIYRTIHTFKGNFAQYNFYYLPEKLHLLETKLSKEENSANSDDLRWILIYLEKEVNDALELDLNIFYEVMEEDIFNVNEVLVNKQLLENIELKISKLDKNAKTSDMLEILNLIGQLKFQPFKNLLSAYPKYIFELSQQLNKEIKPFEITGGDFGVNHVEYQDFTNTLVHIFRNAIDHGIESQEERYGQNKDLESEISCTIDKSDKEITITIKDDGRGLDEGKLLEKAKRLGINWEKDPKELIFHHGFSTKEEISSISGRGVGLGAVKYELEKLDGKIEINSTINMGTTFIFKLPLIGSD